MNFAGAQVIRKQNKYIESFNKYGAIDAEHAIELDKINIRRNFVFNRMVARCIFIESDNGRFYIDNQSAMQFKENRRKKVYLILVLVILLSITIYLLAK